LNGNEPCASFAPSVTLKYILGKMDRECHNSPAVEKKACKWDQPVVRIDSLVRGKDWIGLSASRGRGSEAKANLKEEKEKNRAWVEARIPEAKGMELGVSRAASEEEKRMGRRSGGQAQKRRQEWRRRSEHVGRVWDDN
jgi:hypothetical protein